MFGNTDSKLSPFLRKILALPFKKPRAQAKNCVSVVIMAKLAAIALFLMVQLIKIKVKYTKNRQTNIFEYKKIEKIDIKNSREKKNGNQ